MACHLDFVSFSAVVRTGSDKKHWPSPHRIQVDKAAPNGILAERMPRALYH